MNERDLYLMYLGGKLDLTAFRTRLLGLIESKMPAAVTKGKSSDQLDALALPSAQDALAQLEATPVTSGEDNVVKNYRQQVIADRQANGALANPATGVAADRSFGTSANPQISFPDYTTEAQMNATAKTPSASALLGLYTNNPNGSTTYQDVINAYKNEGFTDQQAKDTIDNAIKGNLKGLDVNAAAIDFDPRGKKPDVTGLTAAQIVNQVKNGSWHVEDAYNGLLALGGYTPQSATAYLQQAKAAPPNWAPQSASAQAGPDPNAVARPAATGGSLGTGVRENLPYNGGPATMENLPYNGQPVTPQPLASYPAGSWQDYAAQAAQTAGLPPSAVVNLLTGEGSGAVDPNSGATWGILPSTAKGMGTSIEAIRADPHLGIDTAVQYLASNAPMFGGDVQKTLASYFIGAGNVQQAEKQAQQNGTDWLTEANKIAAQYGQGTVSDFFASHNLTGDSGTSAGTSGTASAGGTSGTTSNQGGWVTNADGTTSYVPPTPKADLTPEQQLALNQQQTAATNALLKTQQTSAVAAYKAQHPNATLYDLGKGDGSFKVEDPSAPQGSANTWTVQFDPSTGTMQEGRYAISPAVSTLSAHGVFGNTQPTTGVLNPNQIANGTEATRALLAIDPAMADAAYTAAHNGQKGSQLQIQQWLGTSTDVNGASQDYADLRANQATLAATGHTLQGYSAAAGGPGLNTPINVAKDLGGRGAGITPLNGRQQQIYANDPALLNTNGQADAYATGPNGEKYPVYSSVPYDPNNPTLGSTIAAAMRGQGETGLGVSQSGNPLGVSSTGQPGDTTFSAYNARVAGQAENQAAQGGGDNPQADADYQEGYADGQAHAPIKKGRSVNYIDGYRAGTISTQENSQIGVNTMNTPASFATGGGFYAGVAPIPNSGTMSTNDIQNNPTFNEHVGEGSYTEGYSDGSGGLPKRSGDPDYLAGYDAGYNSGFLAQGAGRSVTNQGSGIVAANPFNVSTPKQTMYSIAQAAGYVLPNGHWATFRPPEAAGTPQPVFSLPQNAQNPDRMTTPVRTFATGGQITAGVSPQAGNNGFVTPEKIGMFGLNSGKLYAIAGDSTSGGTAPEAINVTPLSGMRPQGANLPMTALGSAKYRFSGYK